MLPIEFFNPSVEDEEIEQFSIINYFGKDRATEKLYSIHIAHDNDEDKEFVAVYDCDSISCILGGMCDEITRFRINDTEFFVFDVKRAIDGEPFFVSVGFNDDGRMAVSAVTFDWLDKNYD